MSADKPSEMPPKATEEEIKQKISSYGELKHPFDGTTGKVIGAMQRKVKGKNKYDWWLTVVWSDDTETFRYNEKTLRRELQLDKESQATDGQDNSGESLESSSDKRKRSATPGGELRSVRPRLHRKAKARTIAVLCTMLAVILVTDRSIVSDDDDEGEHARNFLYAATGSKVKSLFPPPSKEWPGCKNAFECMQAPDWRGWVWAARMEKQSWQEESVFKIRTKQDRDRQRNTYPLNEVWTRKWHAADGTFDKHKCRLVVLGNLFKRGIDCSQNTWAPTVQATTVRLFCMLAVQAGYCIWKFDIKTAFLLAQADGKYYCFYPAMFRLADMDEEEIKECRRVATEGTELEQRRLKKQLCGKNFDGDDRVLEIIRSVYGSPSAPRSFYLHLKEILRVLGFTPTESEPCLFQKQVGKHVVRIVVHVDDGAVSGPEESLVEFFDQLKQKCKITMAKEVKDFTGLGVNYDKDKGILKLHLKTAIEDAMRRFASYVPKRVYSSKTPLPAGTVFTSATDTEHEEAKELPYQALLGILVWICVQVKIEAATAVSMLGSHAAKWNRTHFDAAIKVLLWMDRTKEEGIVFKRCDDFDPNNCLFAYADADLAGDPDSRRSRSGMAIMMGSTKQATCISHRSAIQKTIALSTTAAEIVALIEATTPLTGIRVLMEELHLPQTKPTTVFEDNQPCIAVAMDAARPMSRATKFYDMRVKKLKELQREGIIALRYCKTCQMLADLYTKNVNAVVFERLANLLTGRSKMSEVMAFFAKFVR